MEVLAWWLPKLAWTALGVAGTLVVQAARREELRLSRMQSGEDWQWEQFRRRQQELARARNSGGL